MISPLISQLQELGSWENVPDLFPSTFYSLLARPSVPGSIFGTWSYTGSCISLAVLSSPHPSLSLRAVAARAPAWLLVWDWAVVEKTLGKTRNF